MCSASRARLLSRRQRPIPRKSHSPKEYMNNYQSESLTNLIPALIRAQSKLEIAEKTKKMGAGEKSPRWKYANWPTLVEASRKALEKEGLCVSQRLIDVPHGTLLSTLLLHTSGEYLDSRIKLLITPASTSQDVGGNITYFKRYAYAALIGLVTDEEDDDEDIKLKTWDLFQDKEIRRVFRVVKNN